MSFFKQFPRVPYDFKQSGVLQDMVDIFRFVRPLPAFLDDAIAYRFYEVKNGERPDIVSQRIYGNPNYYWTFFVVNDHLHDGYNAWPLSQEDLYTYMEKEYEGYVIETDPDGTVAGIADSFKDSLSGRFTLGETMTGLTSGATGTLKKKNADMSQLVIQNVTGVFQANELIRGGTSQDSVNSYRVFKYADAPYKYHLETDTVLKEPVTNALHIPNPGTPGYVNVTNEDGTITRKFNDYAGSEFDSDVSHVTYRTYEFELNEERSKIKYVDPNFIGQFIDKYKKLINK